MEAEIVHYELKYEFIRSDLPPILSWGEACFE